MRLPASPTIVRLKDIPPEGLSREIDLSGDFARAALADVDGLTVKSLTAGVQAQKSGLDVYVRGKVTGEVTLACSRCLGPAEITVGGPFEITYQPAGEEGDDLPEEVELVADDVDTKTYVDDEIDLTDALREELLLSIPLAPVCDELCKGLCPTCGKDLNRETCDCPPAPRDDRFAALRNIKL